MSKRSMAGPQALAGEMDVGGLWRALVARRRAILIPVVILTAAATVFVNVVTPRYAGESRVLLESRVNYLNRPDRAQPEPQTPNAFDAEGVQSQVQVVTSNDLAREAIKRLKLIGNPEFDPSASSFSVLGRLLALLGLSRDLTDQSVEDRVMKAYYDKLTVYPVGKSRVVGIEFTSGDPELAAKAANVIADLYLDTVATAKKDLARSAGAWLSTNIDDLRRRVRDSEAKVEEFRSRNGLFASGRDTTLPQQQLADASTQLTQAKTQQADAQAKAQILRDMIRNGRVFEITEVSNNELIRRLIEQRVTLRAQFALEARTLGGEHPRMKELTAQIGDVEGQIRNAAERTVRGIENEAKVAAARVAQLTASLDDQKKRSAEGLENDVQLRALEREARTLREQLESYLAKYREAVARDTDNAEPPDARVISRAVTPSRPTFPKKLPIILLTALASLIMGAAVVIARELMGRGNDARVVAADERAAAPELIDDAPPATAQSVAPPLVAADEAVRELLARLRAAPRGERGICVAIFGADRAEAGAVVAGVAHALAADERAVLVTLSDAIMPVGDREAGFSDLATGTASFAEAIRRAQGSALHVVQRGVDDLDKALTDAASIDYVMDALTEAYRTVVIDCPADLSTAGRAALVADADHAVILHRGDAPDAAARTLFDELRTAMGRDPWVALLTADDASALAA